MKKKIISDVILNMIATFIPMFVLQFVILPQVAIDIGADLYGELLTVIAFVYLISTSFGSVLNNSKLIHYKNYEANNIEINQDYNIILSVFLLANIIIVTLGMLYYGDNLDSFSSLSLILISVILLTNTYLNVEFRIKLNFKNILMSSVMLFIGYLIGYILFLITGFWSLIYLLGLGISLIFILFKTRKDSKKLKMTKMFRVTFVETLLLLVSGFLVTLGAYIDKLILFPLLGGEAVSVYYTSTIVGKTIALAIGPITGVLLSYMAHMKLFSKNNFKILLFISLLVGVGSYGFVLLVSRPLLTIVYPQYVEEAMKYVSITTMSIILTIIASVINPVLLKFMKAKWQLYINTIYIVIYVAFGLVLLNNHGLIGFCLGILVANIAKLIFMISIYFHFNKTPTINKTLEEN